MTGNPMGGNFMGAQAMGSTPSPTRTGAPLRMGRGTGLKSRPKEANQLAIIDQAKAAMMQQAMLAMQQKAQGMPQLPLGPGMMPGQQPLQASSVLAQDPSVTPNTPRTAFDIAQMNGQAPVTLNGPLTR